jgi:hypothetical protein
MPGYFYLGGVEPVGVAQVFSAEPDARVMPVTNIEKRCRSPH